MIPICSKLHDSNYSRSGRQWARGIKLASLLGITAKFKITEFVVLERDLQEESIFLEPVTKLELPKGSSKSLRERGGSEGVNRRGRRREGRQRRKR